MVREADRRWEGSMPEVYDRCLGSAVFMPHAVDLATRARPLHSARVLELAAGTGIPSFQLKGTLPKASITATDLNQAMVDYGSSRTKGVWQQADAQKLPYKDDSFDLVICQFGVMFFPDRRTAFREVARVLAPGGRFLFNTWDTVEQNDFAAALVAGLSEAFPEDPPTFMDIPHGYADMDQVTADLRAGGMQLDDGVTVILTGHANSAAELATGFCQGTPLRMAIEARSDLDAATQVVTEEMTALLGEGRVDGALTALVVRARG